MAGVYGNKDLKLTNKITLSKSRERRGFFGLGFFFNKLLSRFSNYKNNFSK